MPIRPENKSRYPKNWKSEIRPSILERANNRCEFCGRENHTWFFNEKTKKMVKVVLTVAHLDHTPENCDPSNLRALCQRCHNQYDAAHRAETRKQYKYKREHFKTQQEFERFKNRINEAQKRWLNKSESVNPEKRERRILRQRLYSRYYWHSDGRQSFAEWLLEKYDVADIKSLSLDELRAITSKS